MWWWCRRDTDGVLNFASRRVFPVGDRFFSRRMWIVCFSSSVVVYISSSSRWFFRVTTVWWCCGRDADGVLNFASRRVFPVGDRFLCVCRSDVFIFCACGVYFFVVAFVFRATTVLWRCRRDTDACVTSTRPIVSFERCFR